MQKNDIFLQEKIKKLLQSCKKKFIIVNEKKDYNKFGG